MPDKLSATYQLSPKNFNKISSVPDLHPNEFGLKVLSDTAQGFGATLNQKRTGTFGDATATSFFPAKPLGCYGDGGAIFTDDDALSELLRSLRVHGQGSDKYDNVRTGLNAPLDTIQAAVLLEKLAVFNEEIVARQEAAQRYARLLGNSVVTPPVMQNATSVWAQYTIRVKDRAAVQPSCKEAGVPTAVYYPIPLSKQTGYRDFPIAPAGTPVANRLSDEVVSLPMHAYLDDATQITVADAVRRSQGR